MSSTHALCLQVTMSDSGDAMEGSTDEISVCVRCLVFGLIAQHLWFGNEAYCIVHAQQYGIRKIWHNPDFHVIKLTYVAATYSICPLLLWKLTVFHNLKLLGYGTFGLHPSTLSMCSRDTPRQSTQLCSPWRRMSSVGLTTTLWRYSSLIMYSRTGTMNRQFLSFLTLLNCVKFCCCLYSIEVALMIMSSE